VRPPATLVVVTRARPGPTIEHVLINLGGQAVTRTVKLQANTKESAVQRQLGF
jgi:hypothetical protein